jgi:hypothetical protein
VLYLRPVDLDSIAAGDMAATKPEVVLHFDSLVHHAVEHPDFSEEEEKRALRK